MALEAIFFAGNIARMEPQRSHIQKLITVISGGLYEREHVIALTLLSAMAGESIFLLGLPGVAKSLIGRRLKMAFRDASSFEYLMSRFNTPDEIFGPVSISKLKNEDTYERITDGYLPAADVVFLDEIWKAGPSIQNALLTVLNEKIYRNGRTEIKLPLKGIIAASNELPASNEGLEALWDRFLVRIIVEGIKDEKAFNAMISATSEMCIEVDRSLQITPDQYSDWQTQIDGIGVPEFVFEIISSIRKEINKLNDNVDKDSELAPVTISDRRWKKIIRLMRTSALLNQRNDIAFSDMFILSNCLWDEEAQIEHLNKIVHKSILNHLLEDWIAKKDEAENKINELREVVSKDKKDGFLLYEGHYYNIVRLNKGNTFIHKKLYESLSTHIPQEIVMTEIDISGNIYLQPPPKNTNTYKIVILKTNNGVQINGRDFRIVRQNDFDQITDPLHNEWLNKVFVELTELHGDFKVFMAEVKKQFNENPFILDSYFIQIIDELSRFEINLRKMQKTLNNGG